MLDYRQLQALACVIDEQGFERAARRLFLTQSAVSQRIKQLEESVGQLLLVREQPPRPTEYGQQLLRHYRQVLMLEDELREVLQQAQRQGFSQLAIGLNADTLATWFLEAVTPLLQRHDLLLDLRVDDQDQTLQMLRQGEVVGCISAHDQPIQGASCRPLGSVRYCALATPAFIERYFGQGVDGKALALAPAVEFNQKDSLQDRYLEQYFGFQGDYPRHRVPSSQAFVELIERGYGWGMVPDQQSEALLESGRLVELKTGAVIQVPLYWHSWNLASERVQQLSDCLNRYCQAQLSSIAS